MCVRINVFSVAVSSWMLFLMQDNCFPLACTDHRFSEGRKYRNNTKLVGRPGFTSLQSRPVCRLTSPSWSDIVRTFLSFSPSSLRVLQQTQTRARMPQGLADMQGESEAFMGPNSRVTKHMILHIPLCRDLVKSTGAVVHVQ